MVMVLLESMSGLFIILVCVSQTFGLVDREANRRWEYKRMWSFKRGNTGIERLDEQRLKERLKRP